ncbi:Multi antimicrobial extrusion protein (Na(+)/drug antiporter), MATE family of MDR efflux pumps [Richelia intracellularis]|nr:Multi antimicrobial extrusion protein (Na(+)/drug antiporter), MATE family of MDR efflux pumps [Richelia intracellularis]
MKSKVTEGNIPLELLNLTFPMVCGVFSVLAFSLADTYFVAQIGTNELAAMSFTFPVVTILGSVAMGLGTGASSIIARGIGEGDRQKVQRLTTDSLLLSLLVVSILASLGLVTIEPLFTSLGATSDLFSLIQDYMSIWYVGMVFLVVPLVGNSAIRASGNTVVPSIIMTLAAAANIILDPLLIFGWGAIPALGLQGAALATVISRAITLVASLAFLHFRERLVVFSFPTIQVMVVSWRKLLSVGFPAVATNLISPLAVGFITSLLAKYGAEAVAGFGLASRLEALALIPPLAFSASIAIFVGQNWGAQKYSRVKRALQLGFWFCLSWGGMVAVLLAATAPEIITWFDGDPEVVTSATVYLTLVPFSYGALGIILTTSSALNALGKPLQVLGMSLSRLLFLYIPLAYVGSWLFGISGIFLAASLSNGLVGLGAWLWHSRWINLDFKVISGQLPSLQKAHRQD